MSILNPEVVYFCTPDTCVTKNIFVKKPFSRSQKKNHVG